MVALQLIAGTRNATANRSSRFFFPAIALVALISLDGWSGQLGAIDAPVKSAAHAPVIITTEIFDPAALSLDAFGD